MRTSRTDSASRSLGLAVIVCGLVVGLVGSYADNLLGPGTGSGILQIVLWTASGLAVIGGMALVVGPTRRPESGRHRPSGGASPSF